MISFITLFVYNLLYGSELTSFVKRFTVDPSCERQWIEWVRANNKTYADANVQFYRRLIFQENLQLIAEHNKRYAANMETFKVKMNHFGDLTDKQFIDTYLGPGGTFSNEVSQVTDTAWTDTPPSFVDWRLRGFTSKTKDQGTCGSCWAFSTIAALEGQYFRKTGLLKSFSEQELVDCSWSFGNYGCKGGLTWYAYDYLIENGVSLNKDYPYLINDGECRHNQTRTKARIRRYVNITAADEVGMKRAVATVGPVSAAIFVSAKMRFYSEGFYADPECPNDRLNHAILVVGYGTDKSGRDYWLVKNSWGPKWGIGGYVKIARNRNNQCGIASATTYPVL